MDDFVVKSYTLQGDGDILLLCDSKSVGIKTYNVSYKMGNKRLF